MFVKIGPSTGWLYAINMENIFDQAKTIWEAKASAVEICLGGVWKGDNRIKSLDADPAFEIFAYRSIHLADIGKTLPSDTISKTYRMIKRHQVSTALTHPLKANSEYPLANYEEMIDAGIPLSVENMDKDKNSGRDIDELKSIIESTKVGFVLDVQHAYEQDPEMVYAYELHNALKSDLVHLHISGQLRENRHSLLCKSSNAEPILGLIAAVLADANVPLIIEGEYSTSEDLNQEIGFLSKELGL